MLSIASYAYYLLIFLPIFNFFVVNQYNLYNLYYIKYQVNIFVLLFRIINLHIIIFKYYYYIKRKLSTKLVSIKKMEAPKKLLIVGERMTGKTSLI